MANRQRAEARRKAQAKVRTGEGGGGGGSRLWMWAALLAVIVLGVGIAIFAGKGSSTSNPPPATDAAGNNIPDSQPVTVTGDALPVLTDAGNRKPADDPAVGTVAPVLVGKKFDGTAMTIDPGKGAYMVVFLAHWCPHCNVEVPLLNNWKHSGAVPADLQVYGVTTATDAALTNYPPSTWISNMGWEWPVMPDESTGARAAGKGAAAFGANGWPYFVIVGADGKVKARSSGEITIKELQALVDAALVA